MRVMIGAGIAGLLLAATANAETPSLEGVWQIAQPTPRLLPEGAAAIPFTSEGRKLYKEYKAMAARHDMSFDSTISRCSSPGMPRMMLTSQPIKIFQRSQIVTMAFAWNQLARQIDLRAERPQKSAEEQAFPVPTMKGDSFGHWEGDTLVVETTGLSPDKLLDDAYLPNSEDLIVTERLRLIDRNTLQDEITIADPRIYARSWKSTVTYKRLPEETFPFPQNVCLDDNKAGKGGWLD